MERHDPGDPESISAYAKLEFEQFSFFIQTLTLVVGRKARHEDNVDVHLGVSKSISRIHAKIFYQFDAMSWEIEILGKNGAFINERYVQAGSKSALKSTDKLLIGDAHFVFLLPDGAAPPHDPSLTYSSPTVTESVALPTTARPVLPSKILNDPRIVPDHAFATPVAPHHLMAKPSVAKLSETPKASIAQSANGTALNALQNIKVAPPIATPRAYLTTPQNQADYSSSTPGSTQKPFLSGPNIAQVQASYDKSTKNASTIKVETGQQNAENPLWAVTSTEHLGVLPAHLATPESLELQAKTEEERRLQEEEAAAQHAAQLLHQERLARQAREEEEGLILPPAETDPAVIAALQKPSASYATMIYNAIASHEKKKMTLAQIYSWICINHPYYRYIQNGWQNSIRHNLSLNKAFMKVPRTDDEPGKGSFWAVDPESEMLFEGGVYKKKPPRPTPSAPINRGAPVVMKDGKLALNPNFFVGGIQGKAEEVLQTLQAAVQKQLGYGNEPEQASQLARILALALATQLRQAAVGATAPRQHQVQLMHRPSPATQSAMPRYPATPSPSAYRPPMATQMLRPPQPFGSSGTQAPTMPLSKNQPSTSASAAVVPKHPYMTSPYAINANSSLTPTSTQKGQYSATLKTPALPLSALPSASSTIPLTTNTVYYKPYQASNSTSAVSQGTSTKAAAVNAPVRPPISMPTAQSNKNVPPSPASSYTAGIKTGSLTGGKSAPVQPSVPGSAKDLNKIATPGISTATHNSVSSATNSTPNSNQHGSVQIKPVSEQDKLTPLESSTVAPTIAKDVPSNASINLPNPGTTNMATSTIPPFSESQQKNLGLCTPAIGNGTGLVTKPALDSDHPEGSSKAQVPATQSSSKPSIPNGNVPVVLGNSSALRRTSPERTGLPSSAEVGAENAKHKPVEPANKESNHNKAESFRGTNESVAKPPVKPATTGATCTAELLLASTNSSAQVVDSSRTVQPAPGVGNNGNNKRPIEPNAETSVNKMQKSSEPEQATARTE